MKRVLPKPGFVIRSAADAIPGIVCILYLVTAPDTITDGGESMNHHITWLMETENDVAKVYRAASTLLAEDPDFPRFLEHLANEEEEHCRFLQAAETISFPHPEELERLVTSTVRENRESILKTAWNRINERILTKQAMIDIMVYLEFSEWNSLFLYVVNAMKKEGREFQKIAAVIERHRTSIEEFLVTLPDSGKYVDIIRNLAPLWQKRILILDDDELVRQTLTIIMAPYGELALSDNARDALEVFAQGYFDLVISDIEMPDMTGIDFYREAVSIDPDLGRRFLFISGTLREEHLEFISARGLTLLKKPFLFTQVRDIVTRMLERRPEGTIR